MEQLETNAIDLRLEHTRCKNPQTERRLLASIMERDIEEPLTVAPCDIAHTFVLLDGFKRYRCAKKLGKATIPAQIIATDVPCAIFHLIRRQESHSLSTLEQAALIQELNQCYSLSIYDIAVQLNRSPSWVSMRIGMLEEMSPLVRDKIVSGAFAARAYMYGIRGFTRVNKTPQERIDALVTALSGKGLSTRELILLSRAYLTGGKAVEGLITEGSVRRALQILTTAPPDSGDPPLDAPQQDFIVALSTILTNIDRVKATTIHIRKVPVPCRERINNLSGAIVQKLDEFSTVIKDLYAVSRPGSSGSGVDALPAGRASGSDRKPVTA
jgi:ParB/RepB/Spo0J family partition protein